MKHLGKFALLVCTLMVHRPALSLPDRGHILLNTGYTLQAVGLFLTTGAGSATLVEANRACQVGDQPIEPCVSIPAVNLCAALTLGGVAISAVGELLKQVGAYYCQERAQYSQV